MPKYTFEGSRDGNPRVTAITYHDQGTEHVDGEPPEIRIGEKIELTVEERDRLLPYFILENSAGNDPGEGLTPPQSLPLADGPTSGEESTLQEESSTSASSKKG